MSYLLLHELFLFRLSSMTENLIGFELLGWVKILAES